MYDSINTDYNQRIKNEWTAKGWDLQQCVNDLLPNGFYAIEDTVNKGVDPNNMPRKFKVMVFKIPREGEYGKHIVYDLVPQDFIDDSLSKIAKRIVHTAVDVLNK